MEKGEVAKLIKQNGWQIGLIGMGMVLLGIGMVVAMKQTRGEELVVSKASSSMLQAASKEEEVRKVVVDVEGAVEKPGVYNLKQGERVAEAIIAAGGMAAKADRSYVARFINQASLLTDGMKIYIPAVGEQIEGKKLEDGSGKINGAGVISINSASETELDNLWGVGAARARTIIDNRPYSSIEELVTKAKLPKEVVEKNKDKLGL